MIFALENVDYDWKNPLSFICAVTPVFSLCTEIVQISAIRQKINSSRFTESHSELTELQGKINRIQDIHMYGAACRAIIFLALTFLIHPVFMIPMLIECYQCNVSVNLNDWTIDCTTLPAIVTMNNPWTSPLRRSWEYLTTTVRSIV